MSISKRLAELSQEDHDWKTWREAAYRRASELLVELGREMVQELQRIEEPQFGLFSLSADRGRVLLRRVNRPRLVLMSRGWICGQFFVDTSGSMYLWYSKSRRFDGHNNKYLDKEKVMRALANELRSHGLSAADVIDNFGRLNAGESGIGPSHVDIHGWEYAGVGNKEFLTSAETTSLEYLNYESRSCNLVDDLSLGLLELQRSSTEAL